MLFRSRGPLFLGSFTMTLRGVDVSLADSSARVELGSGTATIDLESLATFVDRRTQLASVSVRDGRIFATLPSIGRSFTAPIELRDGRLVIDVPVTEPLGVRLPRLFRGLEYSALEIAATGATLRFELNDAVLKAAS